MANKEGRPLKYESVDDMQKAIDSYFENDAFIDMGDTKMYAPTMSGLAYSLGICRKTLINYKNKDEFLHAIKDARNKIGVALEQRLYGNNVTGIIFNLKNNFDWRDKQEIETKDTTKEHSDDDLNHRIQELINKK
jgi:hypothetical protein